MSCGDKRTHKVYYLFARSFRSRVARVSGVPGGGEGLGGKEGGRGKGERVARRRDRLPLSVSLLIFYILMTFMFV